MNFRARGFEGGIWDKNFGFVYIGLKRFFDLRSGPLTSNVPEERLLTVDQR